MNDKEYQLFEHVYNKYKDVVGQCYKGDFSKKTKEDFILNSMYDTISVAYTRYNLDNYRCKDFYETPPPAPLTETQIRLKKELIKRQLLKAGVSPDRLK